VRIGTGGKDASFAFAERVAQHTVADPDRESDSDPH
jgi:hypothetical protein